MRINPGIAADTIIPSRLQALAPEGKMAVLYQRRWGVERVHLDPGFSRFQEEVEVSFLAVDPRSNDVFGFVKPENIAENISYLIKHEIWDEEAGVYLPETGGLFTEAGEQINNVPLPRQAQSFNVEIKRLVADHAAGVVS